MAQLRRRQGKANRQGNTVEGQARPAGEAPCEAVEGQATPTGKHSRGAGDIETSVARPSRGAGGVEANVARQKAGKTGTTTRTGMTGTIPLGSVPKQVLCVRERERVPFTRSPERGYLSDLASLQFSGSYEERGDGGAAHVLPELGQVYVG